MMKKLSLATLAICSLAGIVAIFVFTAPASIDAQQGGRGQAATNIAATAQALSTSVASTARAASTNVAGTAGAARTNVSSTVTGVYGNAQATINAFSTSLAGDAANLRATATALPATLEAYLGELPDELVALLESLEGSVSYTYDPTTSTLTTTTYITEASANEAADILLTASGYDTSRLDMDFQSSNLVTFTLIDPTSGVAYTLTFEIYVVDGQAAATLVAASVNGRNIPVGDVPVGVTTAGMISAQASITTAYLESGVTYAVQSINIDDNGALVIVTVDAE